MSPVVIQSRHADEERDMIHRAVQALAEGGLVAFPTETVYGLAASALNEAALRRLLAATQRPAGEPVPLAVQSYEQALDYCPQMPALGARLARRCWPGPVTLVLPSEHPESLLGQLPATVRQAVTPASEVGLRVPHHRFIQSVLHLSPGPLLLVGAGRTPDEVAISAEDVAENFGDEVDLILSDGRSKYGQPSAVLRVVGSRLQVLRQGVMTDSALRSYASYLVVFVCTGNTCRSPMAQTLMQQRLAERLRCSVSELEEHGAMVLSAGVAAAEGGPAASEAVGAMRQRTLDLSHHESRALSDVVVRFADLILTMTHGHRAAILAQWPEAAAKTHVLCRDGSDVSDPIGGPPEVYLQCADQIDRELGHWLESLDADDFPELPSGSDGGEPKAS